MKNNEKFKMHYSQNAYFTLEACLIMPFVFGVIIFIMYVGFYSYDKCLLRQDTYRLLIRGCQIKNASNEDVMKRIKEEESKWYYDKYVMCVWADKRISVEYNSIDISGGCVLNVSNPFADRLGTEKTWDINIEAEVARIHPIDTIRSCRKIESLLDKETE